MTGLDPREREQALRLGELLAEELFERQSQIENKAMQSLGFGAASLAFLLFSRPSLNAGGISVFLQLLAVALLFGSVMAAYEATKAQTVLWFSPGMWIPPLGETADAERLKATHLANLYDLLRRKEKLCEKKGRSNQRSQRLLLIAALTFAAIVFNELRVAHGFVNLVPSIATVGCAMALLVLWGRGD